MKKIIIFLIAIIILLIPNRTIFAQAISFYEGEYVEDIVFKKKEPSGLIHYNRAKIIRNKITNDFAYCIEPFLLFKENASYEGTNSPTNLTQDQILNMRLSAYFGYGYKNHTDKIWYAATQQKIWMITNPEVYYYYERKSTGSTKYTFDNEISEINKLIEEYKKNTSFNNKTYIVKKGEKLTLTDTNNVLSHFKTDSSIATIKENNLIINTEKEEGTYIIDLIKEDAQYTRPNIFYQDKNSQDLIEIGNPDPIINRLTIKIIKPELVINKLDYDTNTNIPQGEAKLSGATFLLYKENELYKTITLTDTNIVIEDLPYGEYTLIEKEPGLGYSLNPNKYTFTINEINPKEKIDIANKVIKAKVIIKKEYGTPNNFLPEKNISFNIYNTKEELIKTIETNEQGIAEIILPYGKYTIKQLTTTEGYCKINPVKFEVNNETTITYNLKDYKINVPNTKTHGEKRKDWKILWKQKYVKQFLKYFLYYAFI